MTSRFSTFAVVLISATAVFGCVGGTGDPPDDVIVLRMDDVDVRERCAPAIDLADFQRDLSAFCKAARLTPRFPLSLVAEPANPAQPLAAMGPGRCSVIPGRVACDRQAVPSRTRRKVRVWERDASV